jgi:hypothetical protein
MKPDTIFRFSRIILLCLLCSGCSKALVKEPVAVSNDRWEMTLASLALGPDQYNTAGGYWEPRRGKRFLWAAIRIKNRLKTGQQFLLEKIMLTAGGKQVRPFILDMGGPVSLRANPEPTCAPEETISRKLIYIVPKGILPEKFTYEKVSILVPASGK